MRKVYVIKDLDDDSIECVCSDKETANKLAEHFNSLHDKGFPVWLSHRWVVFEYKLDEANYKLNKYPYCVYFDKSSGKITEIKKDYVWIDEILISESAKRDEVGFSFWAFSEEDAKSKAKQIYDLFKKLNPLENSKKFEEFKKKVAEKLYSKNEIR